VTGFILEGVRNAGEIMKVVISGASGLIGKRLAKELVDAGHEVLRLVRTVPKSADEVRWDIDRGEIDIAALQGIDAAINLAGENVGEGRWTDEKKKKIYESRVQGTRLLVSAMTQLDPKPQVLISASAIGLYGDRGDEIVTEESARGKGFLADVCDAWETETKPAEAAGIRVVVPRLGAIFSNDGGAFPKLVMPFHLFVGGKIGSGKQWLSWLTIDDLIRVLVEFLHDERYRGAVNVVSPEPVRNAELARALGQKLSRPSFWTVPKFAVELLFGEMGRETVLASTRVVPQRLLELGFEFKAPSLDAALEKLLNSEQ
jgi:uncharacterized protein (TIGR01777 family)